MAPTIVTGRVVTPQKVLDQGAVVVDQEVILGVYETLEAARQAHPAAGGQGSTVDCGKQYILPGFVDIHNHGLGGCDEVMDHWQHPKFSLSRLLQCGTLSVMASIIFSAKRRRDVEKTIDAVESIVAKPAVATTGTGGSKSFATAAVIEGIHAEGPIIEDCGGLPETERQMSLDSFRELCGSMKSLKIMTISPGAEERVGFERLRHLTQIGVRAALGHDKGASEDAIVGALRVLSEAEKTKAGGVADHVPHLTHVYNVMSFHHRTPGLVNYALCKQLPKTERYASVTVAAPSTEIIGDLIHVHPVAIATLLSARDRTHDVALISDCIAAYEPGRRMLYNGRQIAVKAEGGCYLTDREGKPTKTLAGSTVTLADQLHTLMTCFHVNIVDACNMLATTPARVARIGDRVGSIATGKKANLLVVSEGLEEIRRRMVYGHWADDEALGPYRMLRPSHAHL